MLTLGHFFTNGRVPVLSKDGEGSGISSMIWFPSFVIYGTCLALLVCGLHFVGGFLLCAANILQSTYEKEEL